MSLFFRWERNLRKKKKLKWAFLWVELTCDSHWRKPKVHFLSTRLRSPFLVGSEGETEERLLYHLEEPSPGLSPHIQGTPLRAEFSIPQELKTTLSQNVPSLSQGHVPWWGLVVLAMLYHSLNAIFSPWRNVPRVTARSQFKDFTLWIRHFFTLESVILVLPIGSWKKHSWSPPGEEKGYGRGPGLCVAARPKNCQGRPWPSPWAWVFPSQAERQTSPAASRRGAKCSAETLWQM